MKAAFTKAKETGTDPEMALLCLHTTQIDNKLPSPSELLFNKKLKDNLPHVIQKSSDSDDVTEKLKHRQDAQKHYHDQHVKPYHHFTEDKPLPSKTNRPRDGSQEH